MIRLRAWLTLVLVIACLTGLPATATADDASMPLIHYDFDHPLKGDATREADQGQSDTPLWLVNGGERMRVEDAARPGGGQSLQTRQLSPGRESNDDWKAGVYAASGVTTMAGFSAVTGITLMGWVKPTGDHPKLNTTTPDPDDRYSAVGLFGILSGTSEGHLVRALLEVITINDQLRLVALGRREDDGTSMIVAAEGHWEDHLPPGQWTHIAATFDYDNGEMRLYRNGEALPTQPAKPGDPWAISGEPEPDRSSATLPRGIKIGGSFPRNHRERNPFDGRFDDLMFFNRALSPESVRNRYQGFLAGTPQPVH